MKNKIIVAALCMQLIGCASLKYPNWERVDISHSVDNKPCVIKGIKEECDDDSKYECDIWFKKRATLVNANTTVIHSNLSTNKFTGTYFQCENGLPLYKDPNKFIKENYESYLKSGSNTVTGQAFLTQNGGGVVTCAGQSVLLHPDTEYFINVSDDILSGYLSANELDQDAKSILKVSQCDAQGNFEFHKIPAGNWVIRTNVSWNVNVVRSNGFNYYNDSQKQGGALIKEVTVQDGEINKFIISE